MAFSCFRQLVTSIAASHKQRFLLKFPQVRCLHASLSWLGEIVQFKLSDIGEGIAEVQVKEWHVKAGDKISQFDNLCEVQSDKASVTITSRYDGIVKTLHYAVDDIARVGQPLVDIELEDDTASGKILPEERETSEEISARENEIEEQEMSLQSKIPDRPVTDKALATPAVRRLAMENKIKLTEVKPSGRDGRVMKEDVLRYVGQMRQTESEKKPMAETELSADDRLVPIRGYTRIMLKTMSKANDIPHFGYNDEIVVDRLVDLRYQLKLMSKEKGTQMTYMPLFIKAASLALLQFPALNSSLDETLENLTYKSSHNICVAMDTAGGLVVPNVKNCEKLNLWEISLELNRLREAAKRQQLDKRDLSNGTFTLSNIGAIGGTYASPVIFPPQVVIGALGKIETIPRYNSQMEVYPARIVKVSWAADHRVIDGATIARFSNVWKYYLENPALMIAEMR